MDPAKRHETDPKPRAIFIGRNVFIGNDVTILKGITIGGNSIIGSGSIVRESIPANVIAYGNPCIVSGRLTNADLIATQSLNFLSKNRHD